MAENWVAQGFGPALDEFDQLLEIGWFALCLGTLYLVPPFYLLLDR